MTLGELEKRIQEIKTTLKEWYDWAEKDLQQVEVKVCIEDEEGGLSAQLIDIDFDAPPMTIFFTGKLKNENLRIILEDISD